jgi:hypothetical protein
LAFFEGAAPFGAVSLRMVVSATSVTHAQSRPQQTSVENLTAPTMAIYLSISSTFRRASIRAAAQSDRFRNSSLLPLPLREDLS